MLTLFSQKLPTVTRMGQESSLSDMQSSSQINAIFGDGVTCQTEDQLNEYLEGIPAEAALL